MLSAYLTKHKNTNISVYEYDNQPTTIAPPQHFSVPIGIVRLVYWFSVNLYTTFSDPMVKNGGYRLG